MKKNAISCNVAHLAFKATNDFVWYFNSGYSKHMCGDKNWFTSLKDYKAGVMTFGDRIKATIVGKGSIVLPGCPPFEEIYMNKV